MHDTEVTFRGLETDFRSSVVPGFAAYAEGRRFRNTNQEMTSPAAHQLAGQSSPQFGSHTRLALASTASGKELQEPLNLLLTPPRFRLSRYGEHGLDSVSTTKQVPEDGGEQVGVDRSHTRRNSGFA
jgi:hypothetical protein